jgi:TonB family protein
MKYASRKALMLMFILFCAASLFAQKPETPHLVFVTEYIRELAAIENIRASGEQELKQSKDDSEKFMNAIHFSTRMQLELGSQIHMLESMRLNPPFAELIPLISGAYERKIELYQQMIEISSAFIGGPKPDVDYGKVAAEMPKIRAKLDYIDQSLFEATPLIVAPLIDQKPDSQNLLSHLVITKAERAKLLSDLTGDFGDKLNQPNQNYTVSAAWLLKEFLLKDYKCSDDSWEDQQVNPLILVPSGVAQGLLIHQVAPLYPAQARQAHIQGTVVLQVVIGKDGTVQSVQVLRGPPMLIQAAVDAVKQWRYKPYTLDGEPVQAQSQISVKFTL